VFEKRRELGGVMKEFCRGRSGIGVVRQHYSPYVAPGVLRYSMGIWRIWHRTSSCLSGALWSDYVSQLRMPPGPPGPGREVVDAGHGAGHRSGAAIAKPRFSSPVMTY
jgi:hypothetical protein